MTNVQRWLVAAIAGLVVALAAEVVVIRSFGHRAAHAVGYALGVGVFVTVHTMLMRPHGDRDGRRALILGLVLALVIGVASWFAEGAVGPGR